MTPNTLYEHISFRTGDDYETIESLGFELYIPNSSNNREKSKRLRRLKLWRAERLRKSAEIASSELEPHLQNKTSEVGDVNRLARLRSKTRAASRFAKTNLI
ncbi:MAG: hypothetical protein ACRC2T_11730 [Thermoguttaceae bacterium]